MCDATTSMMMAAAVMVGLTFVIQLFVHKSGCSLRETVVRSDDPHDREIGNVLDRLAYIGYMPTLLVVLMFYWAYNDRHLFLSFFVISFLCTHLHMYHILVGLLPFVNPPKNKPHRCPKCKSELIIDGQARMQSLIDHVTDPNGDVPLSNRWVCPNEKCQLHSIAFWNSDGAYYLYTNGPTDFKDAYRLIRKIPMEALNSPARIWYISSKTIYVAIPFIPFVSINLLILTPVVMGDKVIDWKLRWFWHCQMR